MTTVDFVVETVCDECGSLLDASFVTSRGVGKLNITPCERCLDAARQEGRDEERENAN